jgi:hypothetical protein
LKDPERLDRAYPMKVLDRASLRTIRAVHGPLNMMVDGGRAQVTWDAFWQESGTDDFGKYGFAGNNYGKTSFAAGQSAYEVSLEDYRAFKAARMREAVEETKAILNWSRIAIYR